MNNIIAVKKNIWWRWQVYDKNKWLGVAYNPTGCWLFDRVKGSPLSIDNIKSSE